MRAKTHVRRKEEAMTRTLFLVPRSRRPRPMLACVWTATGNPRQPLIRTWVAAIGAAPAETIETGPERRLRLVCA